jgi:hypothetical protein
MKRLCFIGLFGFLIQYFMYLFTLFEPGLFDRQPENERTDVAVVNENAVPESWYNYVCVCVCVCVCGALHCDTDF